MDSGRVHPHFGLQPNSAAEVRKGGDIAWLLLPVPFRVFLINTFHWDAVSQGHVRSVDRFTDKTCKEWEEYREGCVCVCACVRVCV